MSSSRSEACWVAGIALLVLAGCSDEACVRNSDCGDGFVCRVGGCVEDLGDAGELGDGAVVADGSVSFDSGPRDAGRTTFDAGMTDVDATAGDLDASLPADAGAQDASATDGSMGGSDASDAS